MSDLASKFRAFGRPNTKVLKNKVTDLEERLAHSHAGAQSLQNQIADSRESLAHSHANIQALQNLVADSEERLSQSHASIQVLKSQVADLEERLVHSEALSGTSTTALKVQIADLEERLAHSEALSDASTRALESQIASLEISARLVLPVETSRDASTGELPADLREELASRAAQLNELHRCHDLVCQQLAERGAQAEDLKTRIAETNLQAAARLGRESALEGSLGLATQRVQEMRTHIQGIRGESQAKSVRIEKAQACLGLAEQRVLELSAYIRTIEEEGEAKNNRMQLMEERLKRLRKENQEKSSKVQQLEQLDRDQKAGTDMLKAHIQAKNLEIECLKNDLKRQDVQNKKLRQLKVRAVDGSLSIFDNIPPSATVRDLEARILAGTSTATKTQELTLQGSVLKDKRTLESYNIRDGFVPRLVEQTPRSPRVSVLRTLFVKSIDGRMVSLHDIPISTRIVMLKKEVENKTGVGVKEQRMIYGIKEFRNELTLENYGVDNESTIFLVIRPTADKPVITLYPQHRQRVTVNLGLCDGLDFVYLHPTDVPLSKIKSLRDVSWKAWVDPDGSITTDDARRQRVSYLFWEASFSRCGAIDVSFDLVESRRVFFVAVDGLSAFLDDFMERCGFPVKEKQLSSHDYVAIRFFSPSEYRDMAPLTVDPRPDRLVRLFALFKGVGAEAAQEWQRLALADVGEQVKVILQEKEKPVVGGGGFCAFEWGGMIAA